MFEAPFDVFGMIAEFNPFHNGHQAIIAQARQNGATHGIAVMSGNYVQRGEPAITEKRIRTQAALEHGIDLVLELPLPYATATAELFARNAVRLLQSTGVVNTLLFGSEAGEVSLLRQALAALASPAVAQRLKQHLVTGEAYPRARAKALAERAGDEIAQLCATPNNILALEYLRSADALGWSPQFLTFHRQGSAHDSPVPSACFASASLLRTLPPADWAPYVPPSAYRLYQKALSEGLCPFDSSRFGVSVLSQLRRLTPADWNTLPDCSEGLENRLRKAVAKSTTLPELYALLNTKRYPAARLRRLVLAAYLGVTAPDVASRPVYNRVLGFTKQGEALLARMKQTATLPFSTRLLDLGTTPAAKRLALLEERSTDLYTLLLPRPRPMGYEHSAGGVYLK